MGSQLIWKDTTLRIRLLVYADEGALTCQCSSIRTERRREVLASHNGFNFCQSWVGVLGPLRSGVLGKWGWEGNVIVVHEGVAEICEPGISFEIRNPPKRLEMWRMCTV